MRAKWLVASGLVLCAAGGGHAQQIQINKDNKTIAIATSADASALADRAVISIGFASYGKDQDGTYAEATKTSNAVIGALTAAGVPQDAIASNDQNLHRINPDSEANKTRYGQGLRYEFSQSWRVTVPALQASEVLHVAITSGANESGAIQWQIKDEDGLEAEAARKALERARNIAAQMAQGLKAKLGPLVYAGNQTPPLGVGGELVFGSEYRYGPGAGAGMMGGYASLAKNLKPLAITPDRITRSATVYAVFAIE